MDSDHDISLYLTQYDHTTLTDEEYTRAISALDGSSRERAGRFKRGVDKWRFVLGRLLRYVAISEAILETSKLPERLVFKEMQYGKPYLDSPTLSPALGFNLSHDKNAILLAVRMHEDVAVARDIGVDVMYIALPQGGSFASFVESIGSAFTPREMAHLNTLANNKEGEEDATAAFFKLWTLKESYVKALGMGIPFDLSRIEYDFMGNVLGVDGVPLKGWKISSFQFNGLHAEEREQYVCAVCYRLQKPIGLELDDSGGLVVSGADLRIVDIDVSVLIDKMEQLVSSYSTQAP